MAVSGNLNEEVTHAPLEYNNHSDRRPRRRGHPYIDCSRIQQAESSGVGVERKRDSIDLRGSDRDVTSFVVCGHDGAEYHWAIVEGLLRGLAAGVPWLQGKYGRETLERNGEQGILMVGWSEVGE